METHASGLSSVCIVLDLGLVHPGIRVLIGTSSGDDDLFTRKYNSRLGILCAFLHLARRPDAHTLEVVRKYR